MRLRRPGFLIFAQSGKAMIDRGDAAGQDGGHLICALLLRFVQALPAMRLHAPGDLRSLRGRLSDRDGVFQKALGRAKLSLLERRRP